MLYRNRYPFTLMQHQFPIQLAFAITINKAQGQTLGTTSSCVHPWLNLCHSFSSHMHCKYLCLLHKWKIHNHNQCYVSWNASITNDAIAKWLSQSLRFLNGWYKYIYIYIWGNFYCIQLERWRHGTSCCIEHSVTCTGRESRPTNTDDLP